MKCEEKFFETYFKQPDGIAFCPYRVCPIGAHSDHNLGKITGFAIDKGINIAYKAKTNGVIELSSLQFNKRAQWHINSVPKEKQNDWADYLRGATLALESRYPINVGMSGVIEGSLPIGGLSSSAAVIIAFLVALCRVNNLKPSESELINIALEAENKYVGVNCGKLDQSCEVYSKKDHLLYLDTMDDSYSLIKQNPNMKPFDILVLFSGVERTLAGSKFNMRVDEARSAAYALMAYSNMDYGKFTEANLRYVDEKIFREYKDRLPENWAKRAEHWYSEFNRVQKGAIAWSNGDIEEYGRLSFESGYSSIYNWETGSDELKLLYELLTKTKGVYGGRFSGAGFKGCCVGLIDPQYREEIIESISKQYLDKFPNLKEKYETFICHSGDGVKL